MKYLLYLSLLILVGCQGAGQGSGVENAYDTTRPEVQSLKKDFVIEKEKGNGFREQVFVYLTDTSKLKEVNKYLVALYRTQSTSQLDIWYFDKNIIDAYVAALEPGVKMSDSEFKKMDVHMIAEYSFLKDKIDEMIYNNN